MDIFDSMKISSSALKAQRVRLNTISSNIANVETTRTPGGGPYRKKEVVFKSTGKIFEKHLDENLKGAVQGVEVSEIRNSQEPPKMIYDPSHPDANSEGLVAMPGINLFEEMADMMTASRAYDANVTAIKAAKRMALKALEIGR